MVETVEEFAETYMRTKLDEMAEELGLDPTQYDTKREVAEAIVAAREKMKEAAVEAPPEAPKEEAKPPEKEVKEEEKPTEEVKEEEKPTEEEAKKEAKLPKAEVGKTGVIAKIGAINEFGEIMAENVKAQVAENEEAVRKIDTGVKEIQKGISEKEGVINTAVEMIHAGIKDQATENKKYVNDFYYG